MSANFPAIGVMTAPEIRYAVSIQADMLYETSKSRIRSGIAGINIVSAYMAIVARLARTARAFHADDGILTLV